MAGILILTGVLLGVYGGFTGAVLGSGFIFLIICLTFLMEFPSPMSYLYSSYALLLASTVGVLAFLLLFDGSYFHFRETSFSARLGSIAESLASAFTSSDGGPSVIGASWAGPSSVFVAVTESVSLPTELFCTDFVIF